MDELPWVLLGLRTVPKDDLGALSAEMVYGAPLTIPGDFITPPPEVDPAGHLWQLRDRVGALAPVLIRIAGVPCQYGSDVNNPALEMRDKQSFTERERQ